MCVCVRLLAGKCQTKFAHELKTEGSQQGCPQHRGGAQVLPPASTLLAVGLTDTPEIVYGWGLDGLHALE